MKAGGGVERGSEGVRVGGREGERERERNESVDVVRLVRGCKKTKIKFFRRLKV